MNQKTLISLTDLQQKIVSFNNDITDFSNENSETFEKRLKDIEDDIELVLLESTDRQNVRLERRIEHNKKIKEYNKQGPDKAKEEYVSKNARAFLETLKRQWIVFDDAWNRHMEKPEKGLKGKEKYNSIPVDFTPKKLSKWDHYNYVKTQLEAKKKDVILALTTLLKEAKEKVKNIFESYKNPNELFKKLNISIIQVPYSFLDQENEKETWKRTWGSRWYKIDATPEVPKFKKIGHLMKYLLDNNVPFRASNIKGDVEQQYQFYFYEHDITILISDVVTNNCFRDATYVINWNPALRNVTRKELKGYQWKKMVFNENWSRRMESIFTDDPNNRKTIGEEKEETPTMQKTLITDRATFISLIKENFTPETLTPLSYKKFAREYNTRQGNELFLNDTLYGNVSLLGLWGQKNIEDIKNAIFEFKKAKLEIPKNSYFFNEFTKQDLVKIQKCEGFDPEKTLGSTWYGSWILELLRKAYNEEYIDAVKNKAQKEKKTKLEEYTGIKNIPLFGLKITSMLWGTIRSMESGYHKMLRTRFMMDINNQRASSEYKSLSKDIIEYEAKWEDEAIHPNKKKSDRKDKEIDQKVVKEDPIEIKDEIEKPIEIKDEIEKPISKKIKKMQEKTQEELIEILKEPITMETFPLYTVKRVKIVSEHSLYRIVKAYNCPIELRLFKSNIGNNALFDIGDKIEVFSREGSKKNNYINVYPETEKWRHKLVKFRDTHPDELLHDFVQGQTYTGMVNNIRGKFVFVSLTRNYSGRVSIEAGENYKIGDMVKVVFDKIDTDPNNKKIIRMHY
jgi:hypothetical protein